MQFETKLFAQYSFQFGALPSINLNRKMKKDWSLNTKLESRQLFKKGSSHTKTDNSYKYVLTDFTIIAAKKVGLNSRVASGYMIRLD